MCNALEGTWSRYGIPLPQDIVTFAINAAHAQLVNSCTFYNERHRNVLISWKYAIPCSTKCMFPHAGVSSICDLKCSVSNNTWHDLLLVSVSCINTAANRSQPHARSASGMLTLTAHPLGAGRCCLPLQQTQQCCCERGAWHAARCPSPSRPPQQRNPPASSAQVARREEGAWVRIHACSMQGGQPRPRRRRASLCMLGLHGTQPSHHHRPLVAPSHHHRLLVALT